MATQNNINNASYPFASTAITIDPGASGDSYIQFNINTANKFRFGVDDTDDSFRISQGSALGTNDTLIITAAGEKTTPLQPSFFAYNSITESNITGDGTGGTVVFDTEVWDQNSDYNNGTGIFTAPIDGIYAFWCSMYLDDIGAAHDDVSLTFYYIGPLFQFAGESDCGKLRDPANRLIIRGFITAEMSASDTMACVIRVVGGAKVIDVLSTGSLSFFAGLLIA